MDPFEMPETLEGMSREELQKLAEKAEKEFRELYAEATADGATPTEEQLERLEFLSSSTDQLEETDRELAAEEEERRKRAESLNEGRSKKDEEDDEGDNDDGEDDDVWDEDNDPDDDDQKQKQDADALAAGGKRRTKFTGLGSKNVPDRKREEAEYGFAMSPHLPNYKPGLVSTFELAQAFEHMQSGSSYGQRIPAGGGGRTATNLGTLNRNIPEELQADDDTSLESALSVATNEKDLPGGSLVAAAGWCAPSETIYSFLDIPAATELISLPEIGINRGGLRFPKQPDFSAVYNDEDSYFMFTEAELLTDPVKPCFEVPCEEFDEIRLGATGLCITAGVLQQKGWPEGVQVYIDGLLKLHQHRLSYEAIETIREGSGEAINLPAHEERFGAFGALLNAVEMAIVDMRLNQRIPENTSLEVLLPVWAKAVLRADLALRRGQQNPQDVSDAQITQHFANRGALVQWLGDYQTGPGMPGGPTPITQWPDEVEFAVYPAGTWVRHLSNVIEVGNLYDKEQLQRNRYTALFTEDAHLVAKRGVISRRYSVAVQPDGMVGAAFPGVAEDAPVA